MGVLRALYVSENNVCKGHSLQTQVSTLSVSLDVLSWPRCHNLGLFCVRESVWCAFFRGVCTVAGARGADWSSEITTRAQRSCRLRNAGGGAASRAASTISQRSEVSARSREVGATAQVQDSSCWGSR